MVQAVAVIHCNRSGKNQFRKMPPEALKAYFSPVEYCYIVCKSIEGLLPFHGKTNPFNPQDWNSGEEFFN